jgi:TolA-binding protein
MKRSLRTSKWANLGLAAVLGAGLLVAPFSVGNVAAQEAAQEKAAVSSEEAKKSFADAATLQNNNAFEVAVEEWEKFLKNHPKDPLAPKAQHYLGVCPGACGDGGDV